MGVIGEKARVLITVKTTPQPSKKYRDTVCTAGVRLDTAVPSWIRLYPIPFRYLDSANQFRKYDVIELEVRRRAQDSRVESFTPDWESMTRVGHLDPWAPRVHALRELPTTSTCELQNGTRENHAGPSLGLGAVGDLSSLIIKPNPGWSAEQSRKIDRGIEQVDLFESGNAALPLEAPRYLAWYRYRCAASGCAGHTGQILDWELTELQRHVRHDADVEARRKIEKKFVEMMFAPERDTKLFLGNFERPTKRRNFSVLGVWYPKKADVEAVTLF